MSTETQTQQNSHPLSDNERLKGNSHYLRGSIAKDLQDPLSGGFQGDNFQLIRFHGMYEQDDRDLRSERQEQKLEPLKNVMLRCRLPGGIITPEQWLGIDQFAAEHTLYGSIRLTSRQTFQFHGVLKPDIKPMHQWLNHLGLDSIATAGDVNRNVLCTTNPIESQIHEAAYEWAKKISEHLLPRTHAYAEIWLDGQKIEESTQKDVEPILGSAYLPRKFKTTVVIPPHNDVDVHANDLNFVAISRNHRLTGFNVLVGGGLSMDFNDRRTYPNTAYELGYITLKDVLKAAEAVVSTQRDWGDRSDRKQAKTRYTIERVGVAAFKAEVEKRMGSTFKAIKPYKFTSRGDIFGWKKGHNGLWHLTLFIENGRILDYPNKPLKTGLKEIALIHTGDFRLTANQNLIVANVPENQKHILEEIARRHGLIDESISPLRLHAMACVAFPTCPLAMAESERFIPGFLDQIEAIMQKNGLDDEFIELRVTGCPNGCARTMLAEIGLVGRAIGRYALYLGGNRIGTRIPRCFRENISVPEIITILDDFIALWAKDRDVNEGFGDFLIRRDLIQAVSHPPKDFWAAMTG